mmetsp:Transcript_15392/g.38612  ORF Transcript_15392/g.38612 Transcript_15392/m.38612 type:complete len:83 (-) Transcript_15392:381-629(-)
MTYHTGLTTQLGGFTQLHALTRHHSDMEELAFGFREEMAREMIERAKRGTHGKTHEASAAREGTLRSRRAEGSEVARQRRGQ